MKEEVSKHLNEERSDMPNIETRFKVSVTDIPKIMKKVDSKV